MEKLTVSELIEMYTQELQDLKMISNNAKYIKEISSVRDRTEAYAIQRFIVNLKNLPNEPKVVRNNEQKGKKCAMVTGEVNCCNKCLDIPYEPNI